MADEQATAEKPATEEIQEQPTEQVEIGSEAAETQETSSGKGDLNEALRQERERRQELEARVSDPTFIYNQARQLGLTEEEATQAVQAQEPALSVDAQVEFVLSKRESLAKYPQLATDEDDQLAVTALMNKFKLSPAAAADRYYAKFNKQVEAAKVEGAQAQKVTVSQKEAAQSVTSTATTSSDTVEYEEILARTRDFTNPKAAERAQLELIKWKEAHR